MEYADLFYKETGVPVILKNDCENADCDIIVYLSEKEMLNLKQKGQIVDIFEKVCGSGIKDVKMNFRDIPNEYNISDGVFGRILAEPFKIDSFITKNT